MLGMNGVLPGAGLLRGVLYAPYYLGTFAVAAVVTWGFPQAWDWTRAITWPKAAAVVVLLWLSAIILTSQAYNPFIYFLF